MVLCPASEKNCALKNEYWPVVAHAHRMEEIRVGLRHGVDNFEHTGLGTAPGYPEDILAALRERNNGLWWTPTISRCKATSERMPASARSRS